MNFWRNVLVVCAILALLTLGMWHLFGLPGQVEARLRGFLGNDATRDWDFRGLRQASLEEFTARSIAIGAEPVHEARELAVLSEVKVTSDGPFVPTLAGQRLAFACQVGELTVESSKGAWNFANVEARLRALWQRRVLREVLCTSALHVAIKERDRGKTWRVSLANVRLGADAGGAGVLSAQLAPYEDPAAPGQPAWGWDRGSVEGRVDVDPWGFTLGVRAENFTGVAALAELFFGRTQELTIEGVGDLALEGRSAPEGPVWSARVDASELALGFASSGIQLRDLAGRVALAAGSIAWDGLAGTMAGFDVRTSGNLAGAPEPPSSARIDFQSVAISGAWPRLVAWEGLKRLCAHVTPGGVAVGTVLVEDPLVPGHQTIMADFGAKEIAFGNVARAHAVKVHAKLAHNAVEDAELRWEQLDLLGRRQGAGVFAVRKDEKGWAVREFSFAAERGKVTGAGALSDAEKPVFTLKVRLPGADIADLVGMLKFDAGVTGTAEGALDLRFDEDGMIARASVLKLNGVNLGPCLRKLLETLSQGATPEFGTGAAALTVESGCLTLGPECTVLLKGDKALVLRGRLYLDGRASVKALFLDRGTLGEEALLGGDVRAWPLTPEQKEGAVCAALEGPAREGDVTSMPLEDFLRALQDAP